jgi:autotransporter-associated beta strand protein
MVLAGTNSYDGQTDIQSGMLVAANSSALGAGGWNGTTMTWIRTGATLALQGGVSINEHLHLLGSGVGGQGALRSMSGNNALTLPYGGSGSGPGFCFDGDTTVGVDADVLTVTGFYQDAGSFGLTKVGNGTLHISGTNNYTGDTTVNAGTLRLGNGSNHSNLADAADVIVATGATLHLDYTGTDTINELSLGGLRKSPGVYSSTNSSGFITGSGTLTVTSGPPSDFDFWAASHNLEGDSLGDDDHDNLTNFTEYAFGLDPKNSGSSNPYLSYPQSGTGAFTYTRRKTSLSGLTFKVWRSADLTSWTEDTGAIQSITGTSGDSENVEVTLSPRLHANTSLFVRISTQSH